MSTIVNMDVTLATPLPAVFPSVHSMDIFALRHKTLIPGDLTSTPIDSVEILSAPSIGRAVLQDNGTIVVNLDGTSKNAGNTAFTIRVDQGGTITDCVVDVAIAAAPQDFGWGNGTANFQPVDPVTGKWQFLHGEGFKSWYIDPANGLSIADIATDAGVGTGAVDGQFLMDNHPTYGGSEATAIGLDVAFELHSGLPDLNNSEYLFKSGTDMTSDSTTTLMEKFGNEGISSVYPLITGSYGTGPKPIFHGQGRTDGESGFRHYEDLQIAYGQKFRFVGYGPGMTMNMVWAGGVETTISVIPNFMAFNCQFLDSTGLEPSGDDTDWSDTHASRASGLYVNSSDGHGIWYCLFDRCGYDALTYNNLAEWNDGANGTPPSKYSHNVYVQYTSINISYVGNLSFRAASQGLMIRPGGMILENFTAANPVALQIDGTGKPSEVAGASTYTLTVGNLTTQGFKHNPSMHTSDGGVYPSDDTGAWGWGNGYESRGVAIIGDMIMNHNDPNNPADTEAPRESGMRKNTGPVEDGGTGPEAEGSYWLNHNWDGNFKYAENLDNQDDFIDEEILNANTTVQLYADSLLGTPLGTLTVNDLIDHYRGLDDLRGTAKAASEWFAAGIAAAGDTRFAVPAVRTVAQTVKAVLDPQGRTSGKWWNVSADWDTDDYPGAVDGDSVDMQGHRFFTQISHPVNLMDMMLGTGGGVWVSGSSIKVAGDITADGDGNIGTVVAGRFIFDGYSGADKITASTLGGIVINEGTIVGNMDFRIEPEEYAVNEERKFRFNMGHLMLCGAGESVKIGAGDVMEVHGYTDVAFDGPAGTGTLNFDAASLLRFVARGTIADNNPYKFGEIRNKQTGHFGNVAPAITSVVNLNDTPVEIDATNMEAGTYTVLDVDTLNGSLGTVTVTGGAATIAIVGNTLVITV